MVGTDGLREIKERLLGIEKEQEEGLRRRSRRSTPRCDPQQGKVSTIEEGESGNDCEKEMSLRSRPMPRGPSHLSTSCEGELLVAKAIRLAESMKMQLKAERTHVNSLKAKWRIRARSYDIEDDDHEQQASPSSARQHQAELISPSWTEPKKKGAAAASPFFRAVEDPSRIAVPTYTDEDPDNDFAVLQALQTKASVQLENLSKFMAGLVQVEDLEGGDKEGQQQQQQSEEGRREDIVEERREALTHYQRQQQQQQSEEERPVCSLLMKGSGKEEGEGEIEVEASKSRSHRDPWIWPLLSGSRGVGEHKTPLFIRPECEDDEEEEDYFFIGDRVDRGDEEEEREDRISLDSLSLAEEEEGDEGLAIECVVVDGDDPVRQGKEKQGDRKEKKAFDVMRVRIGGSAVASASGSTLMDDDADRWYNS